MAESKENYLRDLGIGRVKKKLISNQGLIEILLFVVTVPNDTLQHGGKLSNLQYSKLHFTAQYSQNKKCK